MLKKRKVDLTRILFHTVIFAHLGWEEQRKNNPLLSQKYNCTLVSEYERGVCTHTHMHTLNTPPTKSRSDVPLELLYR